MLKIINHSKQALSIAHKYGWYIGARYTNLRDIRTFKEIKFIDIDWKNYDFKKHLAAVQKVKPKMTVARDIVQFSELSLVLEEAETLKKYCEEVIVVPKAKEFIGNLDLIPTKYILGFSVPSKYGMTEIPPECFKHRRVHLLGGRPDIQRRLANVLNVVSADCNRFTLDAKFGDFFCGNKFVPHKIGGYEKCIKESIININKMWEDYHGKKR